MSALDTVASLRAIGCRLMAAPDEASIRDGLELQDLADEIVRDEQLRVALGRRFQARQKRVSAMARVATRLRGLMGAA